MPAKIDNPMTNEEIFELYYDELIKEWLKVLARLWQAIGKPVDVDRLTIYQEELCRIPLGLLERTVSRCIRDNRFNNVPTVHDVWEALRKELGNPQDVLQAIQDWAESQWNKTIVHFEPVALPQPVAIETESASFAMQTEPA